ncbi:hypothetical protein KC361_g120 [Hortaea werneckii]|nr:hypothetical protein KC361_g120 [Hortaea werneckii]
MSSLGNITPLVILVIRVLLASDSLVQPSICARKVPFDLLSGQVFTRAFALRFFSSLPSLETRRRDLGGA